MNIFHTQHSYTNWRFQEIKSYFVKRFRGWSSGIFPYRLLAAKYFIPVKYLKTREEQRITKTRARYISTRFPSAKSSKKQILKMAELFVDPPAFVERKL